MDAFELLYAGIARFARLTKEKKQLLAESFEKLSVKKNEFLLRKGEICKYDYFITAGCVKMNYSNSRGVEDIVRFAPENCWITDPDSFLNNKPGFYNIQAVEDSELLQITKEKLDAVCKEINALQTLAAERWQNEYISLQQQTVQNEFMTPEEKFNLFVKNYPGLIQRLPLWLTAAHLGITPDTLGNLKRKQAAALS